MGKSLCFTGHRPQKLIYGFDEQHDMCVRLKARLRIDIEQKINEGVDSLLTPSAMLIFMPRLLFVPKELDLFILTKQKIFRFPCLQR